MKVIETRESETYGTTALQLLDQSIKQALAQTILNRHTDMHLARADEIDYHAELVECAKDSGEKAMRDALAVRMHVQDRNVLLDCHSRRQLLTISRVPKCCRRRLEEVEWRCRLNLECRDVDVWVRMNNCSSACRILDVLDANWDFTADDLLHREWVNNLAPIVRQLRGLVRRDDRYQTGGGHFTRVRCEYTIDFFPDL